MMVDCWYDDEYIKTHCDDDYNEIFFPGLLLRGHELTLCRNLGRHGSARGRGAHQVHWTVKLQQVRLMMIL